MAFSNRRLRYNPAKVHVQRRFSEKDHTVYTRNTKSNTTDPRVYYLPNMSAFLLPGSESMQLRHARSMILQGSQRYHNEQDLPPITISLNPTRETSPPQDDVELQLVCAASDNSGETEDDTNVNRKCTLIT